MNDRGVLIYEMRKFWNISEQDIERIIGGQAPDGDEALEDIAMFFKDLDETYPEVSTESHESAHIHAMIQTAQLLADNGKPVVRPASKAHGPESQVSGLPNLRRNIMVKVMLASTRVKAAAAGVALVLVFGGTAFAGVLPAPIQDAVADAVKPIGIDLPNPDDSQAAEVKSLNNDIEVEDSGGIDKGDKNDQDSVGAEEDADSNEAEVRTPDTDQADDGDEVDAPDTDQADDDVDD